MKLLFIANRIPYPPFRGDKLKIYHLGKCLSAYSEVHLIAFLENSNDLQYKEELEKMGFKSLGDNVLISDKASIYNAKNIENFKQNLYT